VCVCGCVCFVMSKMAFVPLSLSLQTHRTGVTYLLGQPIDACAVVDEYGAFGLLF